MYMILNSSGFKKGRCGEGERSGAGYPHSERGDGKTGRRGGGGEKGRREEGEKGGRGKGRRGEGETGQRKQAVSYTGRSRVVAPLPSSSSLLHSSPVPQQPQRSQDGHI